MDLLGVVEKVKGKPGRKPRNREISGAGHAPQAQRLGTYEGLVRAVEEFEEPHDSVAMAFHPEPKEKFIRAGRGWVRVEVGEIGFQTNSGKFVKL